MAAPQLRTPAFADGDPIPGKYGNTAENVDPPLEIDDTPEEAESTALVMDDPDAVEPTGNVRDHRAVRTRRIASTPTGSGSTRSTADWTSVAARATTDSKRRWTDTSSSRRDSKERTPPEHVAGGRDFGRRGITDTPGAARTTPRGPVSTPTAAPARSREQARSYTSARRLPVRRRPRRVPVGNCRTADLARPGPSVAGPRVTPRQVRRVGALVVGPAAGVGPAVVLVSRQGAGVGNPAGPPSAVAQSASSSSQPKRFSQNSSSGCFLVRPWVFLSRICRSSTSRACLTAWLAPYPSPEAM